jgi:hypothetical protein
LVLDVRLLAEVVLLVLGQEIPRRGFFNATTICSASLAGTRLEYVNVFGEILEPANNGMATSSGVTL